jgi:hypothetical protein
MFRWSDFPVGVAGRDSPASAGMRDTRDVSGGHAVANPDSRCRYTNLKNALNPRATDSSSRRPRLARPLAWPGTSRSLAECEGQLHDSSCAKPSKRDSALFQNRDSRCRSLLESRRRAPVSRQLVFQNATVRAAVCCTMQRDVPAATCRGYVANRSWNAPLATRPAAYPSSQRESGHSSARNSAGVSPASRTMPPMAKALIGLCRGGVTCRSPLLMTMCFPPWRTDDLKPGLLQGSDRPLVVDTRNPHHGYTTTSTSRVSAP